MGGAEAEAANRHRCARVTRHVTTDWELERIEPHVYHRFTLWIEGEFSYATATRDDPGDCRLELDRVTCGGEPFDLTLAEETAIIDQWLEDLRS